jgi:hypothetical protein
MRLNLERRRKNDRMDGRELCMQLSRYLDGHGEELKPIHIPSRAEQRRRELGRQWEFWKKELRRLDEPFVRLGLGPFSGFYFPARVG